jgi:Pyruvate/2-oxoacid:ferredoxin oxidoreductase gamma subunit
VYDAKKSGGVTVSHLRFGPQPLEASYLIGQADYLAVHHQSYIHK